MSVAAADLRMRLAPRFGLPLWVAAPALLGVSRLLPADGAGLAIRLAAATACLLLPGALISRALGLEGLAPALVWSLAALFAGMALMFAVEGSIWLALGVMGGLGLLAAPFALRRPAPRLSGVALGVLVLGAAAGIALWSVAYLGGDAFFHLARVRKLVDFGSISLRSLDEYRDGGLHPGYAFPLWHGFVALVSKLAGVDPTKAMLHLPTVLTPLFFLLTYESGVALFRSRWAGLSTLFAAFALLGLAPGHGGALTALAQAPSASRMLVLPALLALAFAYLRAPSWPLLVSVGAAAGAMTLMHAPHTALVLVVLGGFVLARWLLVRTDFASGAALLGAIALPTGAVVLWLLPVVRNTAGYSPGGGEVRRAFANYPHELDVFGLHSYRLKPELFGRGGSVALAALVLAPLAVFAVRRRWAALALGGTLAVFAIALLQFLFPHFADALSISQARRLVGFAPRMFVVAGAALVLTRLLRVAVLPAALAAGILLQIRFPGDFGTPYRHDHGGPAWLTWASFAATGAALLVGVLWGKRLPTLERDGPLATAAVALFVLPVAVHGYSHWGKPAGVVEPLPAPLVQALRERVPERAVVFSDAATAYQVAAFLPVYVNATPATHSSDTKANHPARRVREALRFFHRGGPLSVLHDSGADWLLVDRRRALHSRFPLPRAYADGRYVLYRVP